MKILNTDQVVVFPNKLFEKFTLELTIFSPENKHVGVATFSDVEDTKHIIRLYQLLFSFDSQQYNVIQEIAAFRYQSRQDLDNFLKRLPSMSAIEMLMMLHPVEPFQL